MMCIQSVSLFTGAFCISESEEGVAPAHGEKARVAIGTEMRIWTVLAQHCGCWDRLELPRWT